MKLLILDGNSIVNRAFYGIRPLSTREGLPTHAVYGFLTTMQRLVDEESPDALCVAFDLRAPTFRHKEYDGYKAQRKGMPEELAVQMPVLKEVLDAMNIPRYELEGFEADDLIGTVSRRCEAAGWECVAATGDKDSLQLITGKTRVKLVSTRMGQTTTRDMTHAQFLEDYGFEPIHMIDLKALMGDASDNIPGVAGIGEKTAMALVQHCGSIDALYADLDAAPVKGAALAKLRAGEEMARLSYRLATIVTDAPLDFAPEENLRRPFSPDLYPLFLKLEFHKLIEKYALTPSEAIRAERSEKKRAEVIWVETAEAAEAFLTAARAAERVSVLGCGDGVFCVYLGDSAPRAYMLAAYRYGGGWDALLRALFSADVKKVSHDVKDLINALLAMDLPADGFVFDTALAAYVLDATAGSYDIARLYTAYFSDAVSESPFPAADDFAPLGGADGAAQALCDYAAGVLALYGVLAGELEARGAQELYYDVELPLCSVLARMERCGCRIDTAALAAFGKRMGSALAALEQEIYEQANGAFNINSPKQLGEVLFDRLGLPHGKRTKTGWSTNADVLEKLRYEHPIVENVLRYRQYAKLKSTYADGLLEAVDADGRVRTSFQMTVTATGRLSSTEPNLQNIPTRTEIGSELRRMFVPDEGCVLVDADYSQIELRLLAHIAQDETMLRAFADGTDIHAVTASQVFGVPQCAVTAQMRSHAKAVNFGIVYGISAFSLSQDIGVSVAEAKSYMESYLAHYDGVRTYMDAVVARARREGYVETLMHRRRALPEINASNFQRRSFSERVALNTPIQGTAADLMKAAMVKVDARLRAEGLAAHIILQVHDELIVECPAAEAERVCALLTQEMESVAALSVALTAEAHSGENWLAAKG
ncbi:MAG: DNA polymerase I [Oscillospiraceae bacterium]|nr:DNA polymerase I [Oscillospiraceae bacterium]